MADNKMDQLLAAKQAADQALHDAEQELLDELAAAKADYRDNPDDAEFRADFKAAVADVQALRAVQRQDRDGVGVAGDAFLAAPTDEGA